MTLLSKLFALTAFGLGVANAADVGSDPIALHEDETGFASLAAGSIIKEEGSDPIWKIQLKPSFGPENSHYLACANNDGVDCFTVKVANDGSEINARTVEFSTDGKATWSAPCSAEECITHMAGNFDVGANAFDFSTLYVRLNGGSSATPYSDGTNSFYGAHNTIVTMEMDIQGTNAVGFNKAITSESTDAALDSLQLRHIWNLDQSSIGYADLSGYTVTSVAGVPVDTDRASGSTTVNIGYGATATVKNVDVHSNTYLEGSLSDMSVSLNANVHADYSNWAGGSSDLSATMSPALTANGAVSFAASGSKVFQIAIGNLHQKYVKDDTCDSCHGVLYVTFDGHEESKNGIDWDTYAPSDFGALPYGVSAAKVDPPFSNDDGSVFVGNSEPISKFLTVSAADVTCVDLDCVPADQFSAPTESGSTSLSGCGAPKAGALSTWQPADVNTHHGKDAVATCVLSEPTVYNEDNTVSLAGTTSDPFKNNLDKLDFGISEDSNPDAKVVEVSYTGEGDGLTMPGGDKASITCGVLTTVSEDHANLQSQLDCSGDLSAPKSILTLQQSDLDPSMSEGGAIRCTGASLTVSVDVGADFADDRADIAAETASASISIDAESDNGINWVDYGRTENVHMGHAVPASEAQTGIAYPQLAADGVSGTFDASYDKEGNVASIDYNCAGPGTDIVYSTTKNSICFGKGGAQDALVHSDSYTVKYYATYSAAQLGHTLEAAATVTEQDMFDQGTVIAITGDAGDAAANKGEIYVKLVDSLNQATNVNDDSGYKRCTVAADGTLGTCELNYHRIDLPNDGGVTDASPTIKIGLKHIADSANCADGAAEPIEDLADVTATVDVTASPNVYDDLVEMAESVADLNADNLLFDFPSTGLPHPSPEASASFEPPANAENRPTRLVVKFHNSGDEVDYTLLTNNYLNLCTQPAGACVAPASNQLTIGAGGSALISVELTSDNGDLCASKLAGENAFFADEAGTHDLTLQFTDPVTSLTASKTYKLKILCQAGASDLKLEGADDILSTSAVNLLDSTQFTRVNDDDASESFRTVRFSVKQDSDDALADQIIRLSEEGGSGYLDAADLGSEISISKSSPLAIQVRTTPACRSFAKLKIEYRKSGSNYDKTYIMKFPCVRYTNQEAGREVHITDVVKVDFDLKSVVFTQAEQSIQIAGVDAMWGADGHSSFIGACSGYPATAECTFGGADSKIEKANVMEWMKLLDRCGASGDDWDRTATVCRRFSRTNDAGSDVFEEERTVRFRVVKDGSATGLISVQSVAGVDFLVNIDEVGLESCGGGQFKHELLIDVQIDDDADGNGFEQYELDIIDNGQERAPLAQGSFDALFSSQQFVNGDLRLESTCRDVTSCDGAGAGTTSDLKANGDSIDVSEFVVYYTDTSGNIYANQITVEHTLDQCPLEKDAGEIDLANGSVDVQECVVDPNGNDSCATAVGEIQTDSYIKAVLSFLNSADWAEGITVTAVKLFEDCSDAADTSNCANAPKSCAELSAASGYQQNGFDICSNNDTTVTLATDNLIGISSVIEFEFSLNGDGQGQRRRLLRASVEHAAGGFKVLPASMEVSDKMESEPAAQTSSSDVNLGLALGLGAVGILSAAALIVAVSKRSGVASKSTGGNGYVGETTGLIRKGRFTSNIAF